MGWLLCVQKCRMRCAKKWTLRKLIAVFDKRANAQGNAAARGDLAAEIDFFLPGYIKQAFSNVICRDAGEIVPLAAT